MLGGPETAVRRRLLVVEDNVANQKVALAMLRQIGWEADVAGDGAQAVEAFREGGYAAVLMDCRMPVLDGYAAAAAIRELEADGTRTPIIAMTASVMSGEEERCRAAGMDDYVPKPIMLPELASALQRWLGSPPEAHVVEETGGASTPADPFDPARVAALRALRMPGGGDAFLHFAKLFVEQGADQLSALGQAVADDDREGVEQQAHTLRGGAATIGATRLVDRCTRLEEQLASGDPPETRAFEGIRAEFEAVKAAVAGGADAQPPPM